MLRHWHYSIIALLLLLTQLSRAAEKDPVGAQVDWTAPIVETRRFDPARQPPEMPKLHYPEAAETVTSFSCQTAVSAALENEKSANGRTDVVVRVKSVDFKSKVSVVMWLPNKVTKKIVAHEDGHRQLSEIFYDAAREPVIAACQNRIGQLYSGSGNTSAAAVRDAIDKAIAEINNIYVNATNKSASPVQQRYDIITRHGTNKVPEDEAIRMALDVEKKRATQ